MKFIEFNIDNHSGLPLPTVTFLSPLPSAQSNSSNTGSSTKPSTCSWPTVAAAALLTMASTCPVKTL